MKRVLKGGFFKKLYLLILLLYPLFGNYFKLFIPNYHDIVSLRFIVPLILFLFWLFFYKKNGLNEKRELILFVSANVISLHFIYLLVENSFNQFIYSSFLMIPIFYALINREKFLLYIYQISFLLIILFVLLFQDFISIDKLYAIFTFISVLILANLFKNLSEYYINNLKESKEYFYKIFNSNLDGLLEIEYKNGGFYYLNSNVVCREIFEIDKGAIIDVNYLINKVPLLRESIEKCIKNSSSVLYETAIYNRFFSVFIQKLYINKKDVVLINFRDISKIKTYKERLIHSYFHDKLTGLPNKTLFFDRLKLEISHAKRGDKLLAIVYLDLINFKSINELTNYKLGDLVLKEVAKKIKFTLRTSDTLSRFGDDEFVMIFSGLNNKTDISSIINKIVKIFSKPFVFGDNNFFLNVAIGVSFYPNDAKDVNELVKLADMAMLKAKESNEPNSFMFYESAMQNKTLERLIIENTLNLALSNSEFRIYYQPIIDLSNGEVFAVEALIRWNHPEFGMISPDKFIYIAENMGLISNIDNWMSEQIFSKIDYFQQLYGKKIKFSLNYSAFTFKRLDLLDKLINNIENYNIDKSSVIIELTETVFVLNENIIEFLNSLKNRGICLAIDDFGTGYSSISYLKDLTVDYVKLDKKFLDDLESDEDGKNYRILKAIVKMLNELKLDVIVEGVETKQQRNVLSNIGVDTAQGYLFSRPIPEDEFSDFLVNVKNGIINFLD